MNDRLNSKIIRESSKILSVSEDDLLKSVDKFIKEIDDMKSALTKHEVRRIGKGLDKV